MGFLLCSLALLFVAVVMAKPPPSRMTCTQDRVTGCLNRPDPSFWPDEAPPMDCRFVQCFSGCSDEDEVRENLDEASLQQYRDLMTDVASGVCPAGPVCEDWFVDVCAQYMRNSPIGRSPCAMLFCYRPCMGDPAVLSEDHQATFHETMEHCAPGRN